MLKKLLHRLVEIHYKIGLIDESKKYAALLGYNYQSGEWYKDHIKFLTKIIQKKKRKKQNKASIDKEIR